MFAKDEDYLVRASVAKNSNVPKKILEILAKDEDYYVRESVARNPNTSRNVLNHLLSDENIICAQTATEVLLKKISKN